VEAVAAKAGQPWTPEWDLDDGLPASERELVAVDLEPVEELVGAGGKRARQIVDSLLLIDDRLARRLAQRLGLS
jgi:hypothetical protein